jgi:hypothetical protein
MYEYTCLSATAIHIVTEDCPNIRGGDEQSIAGIVLMYLAFYIIIPLCIVLFTLKNERVAELPSVTVSGAGSSDAAI